ncbi:MAG: hypothetical protein ACK5MT_21775 [Actinomycetales bacterium]
MPNPSADHFSARNHSTQSPGNSTQYSASQASNQHHAGRHLSVQHPGVQYPDVQYPHVQYLGAQPNSARMPSAWDRPGSAGSAVPRSRSRSGWLLAIGAAVTLTCGVLLVALMLLGYQ